MLNTPIDDNISIESKECSICLISLEKEPTKILECTHTFHIECIDIWMNLNDTCPLCRKVIKQPSQNVNIIINNIVPPPPREEQTKYKLLKYFIIIFYISAILYNIHIVNKSYIIVNNIIQNTNESLLEEYSIHSGSFPLSLIFINIVCIIFLIVIILLNNGCNIYKFMMTFVLFVLSIIFFSSFNMEIYIHMNIKILNIDHYYKNILNTSIIISSVSYVFLFLLCIF